MSFPSFLFNAELVVTGAGGEEPPAAGGEVLFSGAVVSGVAGGAAGGAAASRSEGSAMSPGSATPNDASPADGRVPCAGGAVGSASGSTALTGGEGPFAPGSEIPFWGAVVSGVTDGAVEGSATSPGSVTPNDASPGDGRVGAVRSTGGFAVSAGGKEPSATGGRVLSGTVVSGVTDGTAAGRLEGLAVSAGSFTPNDGSTGCSSVSFAGGAVRSTGVFTVSAGGKEPSAAGGRVLSGTVVSGVTGGAAAGRSEGLAASAGSGTPNDGRVPLAGSKMAAVSVGAAAESVPTSGEVVPTSATGVSTREGSTAAAGGRAMRGPPTPLKAGGADIVTIFPLGPRTRWKNWRKKDALGKPYSLPTQNLLGCCLS